MNNEKIICHITSVHIPFDTRIFHKECKSLASRGYEVHLVARHDKDEIVDSINIHAVPSRKSKMKRMIITVWDVYRKAVRINAQIYHFHDPELIFAGLLLKLRGKKVIADVHEDYPDFIMYKDVIPRMLKKPIGWITEKVESLSNGIFDAVITVTPKIYDRFKQINQQTVQIRNFPFIRELGVNTSGNNWGARSNSVTYIGSITHDRGIYTMIKALKLAQRSAPVRLVLCGKFPVKSVEENVKSLPDYNAVDYRGFLTREDIIKVLDEVKAGLVVIHPNSHFIFAYPTKLFEYMSAGIPVIASDFPLLREIVEETQCGLLVDPLDPKAIADAICYILEHPEEAVRMGENGKNAVKTTYNWENEKATLFTLYENLFQNI
jgi:glycosyltransferase involved in cell wall biosynthesis